MVSKMAEVRQHGAHSKGRKGAIGIDRPGRPGEFLELRPTSHGLATSSLSTVHSSYDRQPVAASAYGTWTSSKYAVKEAFVTSSKAKKETNFSGGNILLTKNVPVHVSLSGEWALQECEEYTLWTNGHLKKGKHRVIGDIRKSIGDGQTLLHLLESLAGEKVSEAYSRPITRAQKLDNLQRCMIFLADKGMDLDSIYLTDLVEGNLKGVLTLCSRLQQRFEPDAMLQRRTPSPEAPVRPLSSSSAHDEKTLMYYHHGGSGQHVNGYGEPGTQHFHVNGLNQEQDDTAAWNPPPIVPLYSQRTRHSPPQVNRALPGQLDRDEANGQRSTENKPLMSTTELDKRAVSQSGGDVRRNQSLHVPQCLQRKPSVEERLRKLLSSPNLGGHANDEHESEEELIIPPPPVVRAKSVTVADHPHNVEERLRILLDETEKDFYEPPGEFDVNSYSGEKQQAVRELDGLAYVPSHPSEKLRNVVPVKRIDKRDSFTGKMNNTTNSITFNMTTKRDGVHFPSTSTPSVPSMSAQSHHSHGRQDVRGPAIPVVKTKVTSSEVVVSQPVMQNGTRRDLYNEQVSPQDSSESDQNEEVFSGETRPRSQTEILNEVAIKLVSKVAPREQKGTSPLNSSPDTPLLPMLSPASSLATFTMDSSDSNRSSPAGSYHSRSRSSSVGSGYRRVSGSSGRGGSSSKGEEMDGIQGQLIALESMYSDILSVLEMDLKDPPVKSQSSHKSKSSQDLKARADAYKKHRSKDIRAVNERFKRLESHLVTLARSVAHLSSELRSQATLSQELEELQKELHDLKEKRPTSSLLLQTHNNNSSSKSQGLEFSLLHRVDKLKKFFGEEPPLVALFLKKLGYERLALKFEAEQISIAELPYMTEERLQNIGIPLGPRLRILDEIRKLTS